MSYTFFKKYQISPLDFCDLGLHKTNHIGGDGISEAGAKSSTWSQQQTGDFRALYKELQKNENSGKAYGSFSWDKDKNID